MPTMDDRIDNWLDSGRFRWPALASLMSLMMLAFLGLVGIILAALTTTLLDGHAFTGGQKLQLTYGWWAVACGCLFVATWLHERRAERRAAAKSAISSAVPRAAGRHVWRIWLHAVTGVVIWLLAAVVVAVIMTAVTLLPLEVSGVNEGYSAFTNIQLLLIGGGWVCVWCAVLAVFSRGYQARTTRRAEAVSAKGIDSADHF